MTSANSYPMSTPFERSDDTSGFHLSPRRDISYGTNSDFKFTPGPMEFKSVQSHGTVQVQEPDPTEGQRSHNSEYESLNYDEVESEVYRNEIRSWTIRRFRRESLAKWMITLLIGCLVGLIAFVISEAIDLLADAKFDLAQYMMDNTNLWWTCLVFCSLCVVFVLISSFLVAFLAPIAAGSGIPEIICFLNGIRIPGVASFRTLWCKAVGVIFSVSAGLAIGKEGPMIHCGAAIASGVSQGKSSSFPWLDTGFFKHFRNDAAKRDFVSAGAAAGVAAAFGAPIGGVLFSLEEGASFWNQEMTWRTLFCAMTSTFLLNFLLSGVTGPKQWGNMSEPGLFSFGSFDNQLAPGYTVYQVPFFMLLGACGGICGSIFNFISLYLAKFRMRYVQKPYVKVIEACLVGFVTALLTFVFTFHVYSCQPDTVPCDSASCPTVSSSEDLTSYQMSCEEGYFNDMSALFWCGQEVAIKHLFHDEAFFSYTTLVYFFLVYFFLAVWTNGTAVPSSPFIPCLLFGCAFGRILGQFLTRWEFLAVDPGTFAMIGASAMLGGVVRMTISLTVILMECTNDVTYGLPIMVTLMLAKWVGGVFTHGLYDILIDLRRIPHLEFDPPPAMRKFDARHVMSYPVRCFPEVPQVRDVIKMLQSCDHHGFAIVDDEFHFLGIILRAQLITLLRCKVFRASQERSNTFYHKAQRDDFIADYPRFPGVDDLDFEEGEYDMYMDLTPYMNPAPFSVHINSPLARVFRLFRTMGLRHLVVVDLENMVQGIITRKDLTHLQDRAKKLMEQMDNPTLDDAASETGSSQWDVDFFSSVRSGKEGDYFNDTSVLS